MSKNKLFVLGGLFSLLMATSIHAGPCGSKEGPPYNKVGQASLLQREQGGIDEKEDCPAALPAWYNAIPVGKSADLAGKIKHIVRKANEEIDRVVERADLSVQFVLAEVQHDVKQALLKARKHFLGALAAVNQEASFIQEKQNAEASLRVAIMTAKNAALIPEIKIIRGAEGIREVIADVAEDTKTLFGGIIQEFNINLEYFECRRALVAAGLN